MFQKCVGDLAGMCQTCVRHVLGMFPNCMEQSWSNHCTFMLEKSTNVIFSYCCTRNSEGFAPQWTSNVNRMVGNAFPTAWILCTIMVFAYHKYFAHTHNRAAKIVLKGRTQLRTRLFCGKLGSRHRLDIVQTSRWHRAVMVHTSRRHRPDIF